ncbi:MAG: pantoate--beta-alanine ligase [Bacteroidetes bacterium]|nr:pantoate--beta-alanine ligase [Bacteroidota bacterium]
MIIFKRKQDLEAYIQLHAQHKQIGFVPTMGALHNGHISLLKESIKKCDITICSIYVNPTQFNDKADLEKYPKPIEADIEKLTINGCDILYTPTTEDIYSSDEDYSFNLGGIDSMWEGPLRPGHFSGVINICKRLFDIVKPNQVFFGQKDFQQCAVIKKMISHYKMKIIFNECDIIREEDGLAMSSRNVRLSVLERQQAKAIPTILHKAVKLKNDFTPEKLSNWIVKELNNSEGCSVDYACVVDTIDLKPATTWNWETAIIVAVKVGSIRLLDNIKISVK